MQILSDLQRQRETIMHSRDTLHTVDTHISRSRQILQTMSRRILHNKVGLGGNGRWICAPTWAGAGGGVSGGEQAGCKYVPTGGWGVWQAGMRYPLFSPLLPPPVPPPLLPPPPICLSSFVSFCGSAPPPAIPPAPPTFPAHPPACPALQLIMWGIILLLLGAIGLVLYAKF